VLAIGKWLRLISLTFSAALIILLLSTVYSLLPTNLGVSVDSNVSMDVDLDAGVMNLTVPVTVANHGFFDIRDLFVTLEAQNSTGTMVFEAQSSPVTIRGGSIFNEDLVLRVNLTEAFLAAGTYHLFHSDNFTMTVSIFCQYTLGLFAIGLHIPVVEFPWAAPLHGFQVNLTQMALIPYNGGTAVNTTLEITHGGWLTFNQTQINSQLLHMNGSLIATNSTIGDLQPGTTQLPAIFPLSVEWSLYLTSNNATLLLNNTIYPFNVPLTTLQAVSWTAPPPTPSYMKLGIQTTLLGLQESTLCNPVLLYGSHQFQGRKTR
jgi:hypothetical protein